MGLTVRRLVGVLVALVFAGCGSDGATTGTVSTGAVVPTTDSASPAALTTTVRPTTIVSPGATDPTSTTAASNAAPAVEPDAGVWRYFGTAPGGSGRFLAWTGTEAVLTAPPFTEQGADDERLALRALDPSTGRWRGLPPSVVAANARVAVWADTELVVFDGRAGAAYSPTTDRWRPLASLPVEQGPTFEAWAWTGDHLIVWGFESTAGWGEVPEDAPAFAISYDPAVDRWTRLPDAAVPGGVPWYGELAWTGREVLASAVTTARGSHDGSDAYPGTRPIAFDPVTGTWRPTSPYPFEMNVSSLSTVSAGRQYWLHDPWDGLRVMVAYEPATDSWTALTPPPGNGVVSTFGAAGERLFAAGADGASLYDPVTDRWQPTATPPTASACDGCAATPVTDRPWTGHVVWTGRTILVVGSQFEMAEPDSYAYTPAAFVPTA